MKRKVFHGRLGRRLSVARLVLCPILIAVAILGLPMPARADGLYTHTVIAERATAKLVEVDSLDPQSDYSELTAILQGYGGIVNYGALFPDIAVVPQWVCWGGPDPAWSDFFADTGGLRANWATYGPVYVPHQQPTRPVPRFRAALMAQLLDRVRHSPRTEDDKKAIAFLFGLISHQEADVSWHPFAENPDAMETKIPSPWNELSIDNLLVFYDPGWNQVGFDFYAQAKELVRDALEALSEPMPGNLEAGETCLEGGWSQANDSMFTCCCWPMASGCNEVRDLVENYAPGGINDAVNLTVAAWIETWDELSTYRIFLPVILRIR
jgi:hypothetical protein